MGGQIAQTIAAAGFPVVLKDINQDLVQAGLDEARKVTEGQVGKLVKKERITAEQGAAQIEEILGRIEGTTSYAGFGDVDFVIEAVPERMEIKQSVFAELDAVLPGSRDPRLQHFLAVDRRDRRGHAAPGQGRRFPLLLSRFGNAACRDRRGRGDLAGNGHRRAHFCPGDPQAADRVPGGPRLRRQPHPDGGHVRALARAGGEETLDQGDRRGRRRRRRGPDGPLLPRQPARPRHGPARRRTRYRRLWRGALLRAQGHEEARLRRQARRQDRRRRLLQPQRASPTSKTTASPMWRSSSSCSR